MNATRTALILAALLCSCQGKEGEGAPDISKGADDPRLESTGGASKGAAEKPKSDADLSSIKLPPGFIIQTYAKVPNARTIAKGPEGTLFIGTRTDAVYAVQPVAGAAPNTNPRNPIGSSRAINTPENTSGIGVIHFGKG